VPALEGDDLATVVAEGQGGCSSAAVAAAARRNQLWRLQQLFYVISQSIASTSE